MTVYVCPTYSCNLKCKHCSIRKQQIVTDIEAIVNASKKFSGSEFVLFGGEPFMLDADSLKTLFSKIDISSISTNLLNMDKSKLQLLKDN